MRAARRLFAVLAFVMAVGQAAAQVMDFESLDGWRDDDHRAALNTFRGTCDLIDDADWRPLCRVATDLPDTEGAARSFFELFFKPTLIGSPPALFTGYFEPELLGSPTRTPRFAYPIYARPPELVDGQVWYSRADIEATGALRGRGLEIAWVEDPVDVFFLQVQGSGRIRMPNGKVVRVGYGGRNGHAYKSIGQELVRRGSHTLDQVSAQSIRAWVRQNGSYGTDLLNANPSYVFFRKLPDLAADKGPIGAMGRSIQTMRSVAVDPAFVMLGTPVWIEKSGKNPLNRLMIAQDTGGAIKGAQRADIFFGTGSQAGDDAGTVKDGGRMIQLLPIERAFALAKPE